MFLICLSSLIPHKLHNIHNWSSLLPQVIVSLIWHSILSSIIAHIFTYPTKFTVHNIHYLSSLFPQDIMSLIWHHKIHDLSSLFPQVVVFTYPTLITQYTKLVVTTPTGHCVTTMTQYFIIDHRTCFYLSHKITVHNIHYLSSIFPQDIMSMIWHNIIVINFHICLNLSHKRYRIHDLSSLFSQVDTRLLYQFSLMSSLIPKKSTIYTIYTHCLHYSMSFYLSLT